ncbi:MAG: AAA family ATPase [Cyanobacteria bacterium J06635_1]
MDRHPPEKIFIIGNYGAGKSTFAHQMGSVLGLSPVHLDSLIWKPGWQDRPMEDCLRHLYQITDGDRWIVEGISDYKGQSGFHDICFEAANTIILFDFPQLLCWWRIFKRRFQYHGKTRPDLPEGYPEKLYRVFLQKVWNYPRDERPVILGKIARLPDHKQVIHFRTPGQASDFLASLQSAQVTSMAGRL